MFSSFLCSLFLCEDAEHLLELFLFDLLERFDSKTLSKVKSFLKLFEPPVIYFGVLNGRMLQDPRRPPKLLARMPVGWVLTAFVIAKVELFDPFSLLKVPPLFVLIDLKLSKFAEELF